MQIVIPLPSDKYPEVRLLDQVEVLFLRTAILFPIVAAPVYTFTNMHRVPFAPQLPQHSLSLDA